MNVDILICTFNQNIYNVGKILLPYRKDIRYIISHQITDEIFNVHLDELKRDDVRLSVIRSKGLSINRNNAISLSKSDICFIADDDVSYTYQYIDNVVSIFNQNKKLDILVGKINTGNENLLYKDYPNNKQKINFLNFSKISSIELIFKRDSILNKNILFDARFGLGSDCYGLGGEESVFICDCLRKKMNIEYYPIYVVNHPFCSSGKNLIYNELYSKYLGALTRRLFGYIGVLLFPVFYIKSLHKVDISIFHNFRFFLSGFRTINS